MAKELGLPFTAELYGTGSCPKINAFGLLTILGDVKYNKDKTLVIDRKKKYIQRPLNEHTEAELTTIFRRAWSPEETKTHISTQLENSSVTAVTGEDIELPIGEHDVSLCCHSDSPGAVQIVTAARQMVDGFNSKHGYA